MNLEPCCTCGLHKSPNEPLSLRFDVVKRFNTEYCDCFKTPVEITPVSPCIQKQNLNEGSGGLSIGGWGLPFYSSTSNSADFIAYQLQPRYVHPAREYVPAKEEMETGTSYMQNFMGVQLREKRKPVEAIQNLKVGSGQMQKDTTYGDEFVSKRIQPCPAAYLCSRQKSDIRT